MDGSLLDAAARRLATRTSRRRATSSLIGAIALGAAWRGGRRDAAAQAQPGAPTPCQADRDCAALADDPCTGAHCVNGACAVVHVDCIDGYVCCGGACCAGGAASGGASGCQTDADCGPIGDNACLTQRCVAGGCVPAPVACPNGQLCRDGVCRPV